jgi:hypothetical protein
MIQMVDGDVGASKVAETTEGQVQTEFSLGRKAVDNRGEKLFGRSSPVEELLSRCWRRLVQRSPSLSAFAS